MANVSISYKKAFNELQGLIDRVFAGEKDTIDSDTIIQTTERYMIVADRTITDLQNKLDEAEKKIRMDIDDVKSRLKALETLIDDDKA